MEDHSTRRTELDAVALSGGVILRDEAGYYYAIPRAALAQFRVADVSRYSVETFLHGDRELDGRRYRVSDSDEATWTVRMSRRSNELWLVAP